MMNLAKECLETKSGFKYRGTKSKGKYGDKCGAWQHYSDMYTKRIYGPRTSLISE